MINDAVLVGSREKEMRRELAEVIGLLISGGAADLGILNPER